MNIINFLVKGVCCEGTVIPEQIVDIIHLVYNAIRIGVPLILVLVGMVDMGKAITQQKEEDIKKAQQLLIKKGIAAVIVFLMFSIVSLLFSVVTKSSDAEVQAKNNNMWSCVDNLIKGTSVEQTACQ